MEPDQLTQRRLQKTDTRVLLKTFAALTHRMHVADDDSDLRAQRNIIEEEIVRRAGD